MYSDEDVTVIKVIIPLFRDYVQIPYPIFPHLLPPHLTVDLSRIKGKSNFTGIVS